MDREIPPVQVTAELATQLASLTYVPVTPGRIAPLLAAMEDFYAGFEAIRRIPVREDIEGLAPIVPVIPAKGS